MGEAALEAAPPRADCIGELLRRRGPEAATAPQEVSLWGPRVVFWMDEVCDFGGILMGLGGERWSWSQYFSLLELLLA